MRRKDREVKGWEGIEDIILRCRTCHLAMVDGGMPYVVPLSFGYRLMGGGTLELYFHSAREGRKMDILRRDNRVCFALSDEGAPLFADTPCDSGYYYSSVIGNGEAVFIDDPVEKCEALSFMFRHQSGRDVVFTPEQADAVCVYKVVSTDFTGKRKLGPTA